MPPEFAMKAMNSAHRAIIKISGGRVGYEFGMPVLELTTIGRKSGVPRSVMLTSPLQDGDSIVVVASRGGDDKHPAWFLNLRDNPAVRVSVRGGPQQAMTARVASESERARLWPEVATRFRNYAGYQRRTTREIPLVLLDPAGTPG